MYKNQLPVPVGKKVYEICGSANMVDYATQIGNIFFIVATAGRDGYNLQFYLTLRYEDGEVFEEKFDSGVI